MFLLWYNPNMSTNNTTKSRFFNRKSSITEEEAEDISQELANSEALLSSTPKEEVKGKTDYYFGLQRNVDTKKYEVVRLTTINNKITDKETVYSSTSLHVAQAKLGEVVARLTMIKKHF